MLRVPICENRLIIFYSIGASLEEIATYFSCNEKTIRERAKELGLVHPGSPKERCRKMAAKLDASKAVQRYDGGDSLQTIATDADTSVEVVRPYLRKKGVKIRSRGEQVASTMRKHGTRFHKTGTCVYEYERDRHGLVVRIKKYYNESSKPVIREVRYE